MPSPPFTGKRGALSPHPPLRANNVRPYLPLPGVLPRIHIYYLLFFIYYLLY